MYIKVLNQIKTTAVDCNQMTLFISFILVFGYELVTYRNLQEDCEVYSCVVIVKFLGHISNFLFMDLGPQSLPLVISCSIHLDSRASTNIQSTKATLSSHAATTSTTVSKVVWDFLLTFRQDLHQVSSEVTVFIGVKK